MDALPPIFGLVFVGVGAAELWIAASLPRLLPALRARAASARRADIGTSTTAKGGTGAGDAGASGAPDAFELLETNPGAMLVVRVGIVASALFSIAFGWRFAIGG